MKGYIAITNQKWFDFQKNHNFEVVNFYRKNKSIFRVLVPGELVFFLVKNEPGNHVERAIKGYGIKCAACAAS